MKLTRREFLSQATLLSLGVGILPHTLQALDSVLKIGYLPITDHLLILSGSLPNAKLSFRPIKFASWADLAQSFSAQAIDAAFLLAPLAFKLHTQKVPIKALMAGHRNGSALVVGANSHIDSFIKLKGTRIAIPSRFSIHYILLCELLQKNNIKLNEVQFIDMAPPEMLSSLARGSIHGFIVAEPFAYQAQQSNVGRVLILTKDIRQNHVCCIFCVGEKLYNNKAITQNLVDTLINGQQFVLSNPQKIAELSKQFLGQKAELIQSLLQEQDRVSYKHLELSFAELQDIANNAKDLGLGNFNLDNFLDPSFMDMALKKA